MKNKTHSYRQFYKTLPALLIIFIFYTAVMPPAAFGKNPFGFTIEAAGQNDFDKQFREGRELIDREEWAKAAQKFTEIIDKYPKNNSVDAALYWLAFCRKKQKQFNESRAVLDRLLKDFPDSSWADDAKVMRLEISYPATAAYGEVVRTTNPANSLYLKAQTVEGYATLNQFGELAGERTPLDREDEIRIAAFQSLLSADAKRGIEALSGILKPDSKASETLKIETLRTLRRQRIANNYTGQTLLLTSISITLVGKEFTPLLRDTLAKSFQSEASVKIRREIIYTLANLKDEQSVNYLAGLYASENDREIKKAIINGFGSASGSGRFSYARLTEINPAQNLNTKVSGGARTPSVEFAKLSEIFRTERDAELRSLALTNIRRFAGWETSGQIVEALIGAYDSEQNEDFKKTIVQILGKIKQTPASKKLLDIARNDKSDKLRLEAIYALRNSSTPEALKFLEELIK